MKIQITTSVNPNPKSNKDCKIIGSNAYSNSAMFLEIGIEGSKSVHLTIDKESALEIKKRIDSFFEKTT